MNKNDTKIERERTPVRELDPNIRNKNFDEVSLGYNLEEAKIEAERCLNCKVKPCTLGCPVGVKIPDFIAEIRKNDLCKAYKIISQDNNLPAICGRVCPQEQQCEKLCVRCKTDESVAIGRLERFIADWYEKNDDNYLSNNQANDKNINKKPHKIAVIGSGPAGLTCAGELAKMGYGVDIFEALHVAGGVLSYGIPEFRLPKKIVHEEINKILSLGVNINLNTAIGRTIDIDELLQDFGYSAIFIGSGAGLPNFMNIEGENLGGVFSANEYLTRVNLMKAYDKNFDTPVAEIKNAAVIGGGNVAMDAARCAKRLGAKNVYIVYRRSEIEMPARLEEIEHAKQEGIIFKLLSAPIKINGNEKGGVKSMDLAEMKLGEPDERGRRSPIETGNIYNLEVDTVIVAIGTSPNPIIAETTPEIAINRHGCIQIGEDEVSTSKKGIFAGGDAVSGAATVILAMGAGKKAAVAIDKYICENF